MFNLRKTLLVSTSVLGLLTHSSYAIAQEGAQEEWLPRTVEQVKEDLMVEGNKMTYTVKSGDTLSVIAEAMDIDMDDLAQINDIDDVDIIVEGTILTVWLNENHEVESIQVETPEGQVQEFPVTSIQQEETAVVQTPSHLAIFTPEVQLMIEPVDEWNAQQEQATPLTGTQVSHKPVVEESEKIELDQPQYEEETQLETTLPNVTVDQVENTNEGETQEVTQPDTSLDQVEDSKEETDVVVDENVSSPESSLEETTLPENVEEQIKEDAEIEADDIVESTPDVAPEVEDELDVEQTYTPDPNDPSNIGLKPHVVQFKEEVAQQYDVTQFSGYRPGDSQDHGKGLAIDFMVYDDTAKGDAIAEYSVANMDESNIYYVIWKQQIYGTWTSGWEPMEDRGSVTANHYDHVHVSFNP